MEWLNVVKEYEQKLMKNIIEINGLHHVKVKRMRRTEENSAPLSSTESLWYVIEN